jgi:hypothetical protein
MSSWRAHHLEWRSTFIRGALRVTSGKTYKLPYRLRNEFRCV